MDEIELIRLKKMRKLLSKMGEDKKEQVKEVVINVTDEDFNEKVINQSKNIPVVVDFWASWCMPCLMLGPILESLAKIYKGKFILAKLNVDENRMIASKYRVMGIPSVKMFKDGRVVDEFVGALPEEAVRAC